MTVALAAFAISFNAYAIERSSERIASPSPVRVPMPQIAKPATTPAQPFPKLPVSNACTPQDIKGLWQLGNVFEMPAGAETASFAASRFQYVYFQDNSLYGRYNASQAMPADQVRQQITTHAAGLMQYVVQNGFVYFYQNQALKDTQACFIVANANENFSVGQMILMPPKGQIQGRLVKTYTRMGSGVPSRAIPNRPIQPPQR